MEKSSEVYLSEGNLYKKDISQCSISKNFFNCTLNSFCCLIQGSKKDAKERFFTMGTCKDKFVQHNVFCILYRLNVFRFLNFVIQNRPFHPFPTCLLVICPYPPNIPYFFSFSLFLFSYHSIMPFFPLRNYLPEL